MALGRVAAEPGPLFRYARAVAEEQPQVADLLVRCLENEGVTCVFGIPGEENIRVTDALFRSSIRYVLVRHEQAASFMAEIHGRLTGRAGVCSSTLGPGAINLLLGTADANSNSTPMVAISAQVGLNRIYKESHQSVDLVSMFAPVTKWADMVLSPGRSRRWCARPSSWHRPNDPVLSSSPCPRTSRGCP